MAFDGFTIAALVSEMDAKLTGGHIQKIAQPEADELLLSIKNNKTQYKLQISASPSLPLIHLTNSPKPSPFTARQMSALRSAKEQRSQGKWQISLSVQTTSKRSSNSRD